MHVYNEVFYDTQSGGSLRSAKAIVPTIIELLSPKSVVDIGCGVGTWLSVFSENGVSEILGLDGPYVQKEKLKIPSDHFLAVDLNNLQTLGRSFDLAVCLEVAEHLPEAASDSLVDALTSFADAVLFSAAIPNQGGEHHINEQWPEFWHKKFSARNFVAFDFLRKSLWTNEEIEFWYRQNLILYVRAERVGKFPRLPQHDTAPPLSLVHPLQYTQSCTAKADLELAVTKQSNLILQLRKRIEELKDPSQHSPWSAFVFFLNSLLRRANYQNRHRQDG